jgi:hypothetical protein
MADLTKMFPHPLPCIAIEERTSLSGWPEYEIVLLSDDGRKTLCLADDHAAAVTAANEIGNAKGLPVADLSRDDYAR